MQRLADVWIFRPRLAILRGSYFAAAEFTALLCGVRVLHISAIAKRMISSCAKFLLPRAVGRFPAARTFSSSATFDLGEAFQVGGVLLGRFFFLLTLI